MLHYLGNYNIDIGIDINFYCKLVSDSVNNDDYISTKLGFSKNFPSKRSFIFSEDTKKNKKR